MSDRLLHTARRVAGGAFEILGELGRSGDERVAYLARESPTGELVALTFEALPGAALRGSDPSFAVRRALDTSVPASGSTCPACGAVTETWARYCSSCRHDLSGGPPPVEDKNTGRMLAQTAARGRFELLGDMARSEGGSPVYFGREEATGGLVALRLEPMDDPEAPVPFTLSVTQRIESASGRDDTDTADRTAATETAVEAEPETSGRVYVCPLCDAQYATGTYFCPRDGTALRPKVRTQDLVGQTVGGRYRVVERLGQGGMGQVYKAVHVRMGSHCAIKIMNPTLETDPEALGRFAREATLASRIEHPNVARVYDFGETESGLLFIAMEFVEGESLSAIISAEGPLEPTRAAELAWQVADALSAAHDLGTVHRDIKPDNIIVTTSRANRETATVVDFGIAKGIEVSEDEQVTRAGFVVGNPKYMSPEQLIGETTDERGDVYSLGCVLYEMLVGESAFSGATGAALLTQRLTEPAPSPHAKLASVPKELDAIVVRALAREREHRYASAIEMRDALHDFIVATVTDSRRVTTDRQRAFGPSSPPRAPTPPAASPREAAATLPEPALGKASQPAPGKAAGSAPGKAAAPALGKTVEPALGKAAEPAPRKAAGPAHPHPAKSKASGPHPSRPTPAKRPKPLLVAGAVAIIAILVAVFWPRGATVAEPGTLVIQGALPAGAAITARDEQGNVTTVEGTSVQLAAGPYQLFFQAPGHESDEARVVVESGTSVDWRPAVVPFPVGVVATGDTTDTSAVTGGGGAAAGGEPVADAGGAAVTGAGQTARGGQASGGGPPPDPVWSRARADSVTTMLNVARAQASAGQFTQATRTLGDAESRVRNLRAAFRGQAALGGLDQQIGQVRDSIALLRQEAAAPRFQPSSADSIRDLLGAAWARKDRRQYDEALRILTQADDRLAALLLTFPNEPALNALTSAIADSTTVTRTACEAWRQTQLERGLPAPACN